MTPEPNKIERQRRLWLAIVSCLAAIGLFTYLETRVYDLDAVPFPVSGNVLVFLLINVNALLLLLMVFLVLRKLVELVFERRRALLGTRLRTRLVLSFIALSLIPTTLLFFIALQFVSTSMDYWFNSTVEQSLQESLHVAQDIYRKGRARAKQAGQSSALALEKSVMAGTGQEKLENLLNGQRQAHELFDLRLLSGQYLTRAAAIAPEAGEIPALPTEILRQVLDGRPDQFVIQPLPEGELVRFAVGARLPGSSGAEPDHILVASLLIPKAQIERMQKISRGIEGYRQLMLLKTPIKTSLLVMLLIVTLLIVFSAVWFGFYVAQGLTGPIGKLAEATRRVAAGDLGFVLPKESDDEMGLLVDSFNCMTRDLLTSKKQLEEANEALRQSNLALDTRRQYTETILQNVAAGVISFDAQGLITTINRFAEELLRIDKSLFLGKDFRTALPQEHLKIIESLLGELENSGKTSIQRPIRLSVRKETFSLLVNFTKLEDEQGAPLGIVLVFDNLTQLEKVQRVAAWREVARRIAHEVKNPLTPIQLSAQRLRKRYLDRLADEGEVFDLCTRTIINQVEELRRLVSEFSNFARMPAVEKKTGDLAAMVEEALVLYREGHKGMHFLFQRGAEAPPPFSFDPKQMKRVLFNLLDNAVAALDEQGTVEVALRLEPAENVVFLEVSDNGPGVPDEDKLRLFEPYFSTKKSGTGLGLAIASSIVADHGGYIRVRDNTPRGARFVVELPFVV